MISIIIIDNNRGCSGRGVQWMGVVLCSKTAYNKCEPLHPLSNAPPLDES